MPSILNFWLDKFLRPRAPCTRQPYEDSLSSQKFKIEAAGIKKPCRPSVYYPFSTVWLCTVPLFGSMDNIHLNKLQPECGGCMQERIFQKNHENRPRNGKFFTAESAQKVSKPLKFPPTLRTGIRHKNFAKFDQTYHNMSSWSQASICTRSHENRWKNGKFFTVASAPFFFTFQRVSSRPPKRTGLNTRLSVPYFDQSGQSMTNPVG